MMDRAMVEPDRGCDWDSMSYLCLIVCANCTPMIAPTQALNGDRLALFQKTQHELGRSDTLLNQYFGAQIK